ncbi:amidohydrolase family protein [Novosphingobium album (ex Liu et al. 2023)]|uniref:Amidohydrolase family protein n=1 Tax=Novosphingobium album (ex Liu et al. 2023) TaxID=3031130 RepID=A0ABT5WXI4_9SPHN|nr:amidohydrolase family protein [Novosphingobium album (ex Liu et al. 2023)]MDE8654561.1 amidohydrolase family protein [Novosphingobium album (ex Liu et al. 2023)]
MKMEDMVIISVDDHITEPGNVFDNQLSGEAYATAPKLKVKSNGSNYWEYQGRKIQSVALNAVTGRVREEYGMEPTSLDQLRKGCWDVDARIGDMNINGIAASLNFPSFAGIDGGLFIAAEDKAQSVVHMRAYNDWHIDEWCGSHPGRFIPLGVLPLWDMAETAREVRRLADKGCFAVTMSDNPTMRGLPSIHNAYWEPLWKAVADCDSTICLHIGTGNISPHCSMESPIEVNIATMPMAVAFGAADWLNLSALHRYPTLKVALSESGIGWIPYLMERADYSHEQHHVWTHSNQYFGDMKPSDVFKRHFTSCFIDDAYGLRNLDLIGEDNVCYEVDFPHSDAPWPNAPEILWKSAQFLTDSQIDKVTHRNAMRVYNFDMFAHHKREELTVGALRAQASAAGVDTTLISTGGAAPLAEGEEPRPVTSGDVVAMYKQHAEAA